MTRQGALVDCSPERLQRALTVLRSGVLSEEGAGPLYRCYYRRILGFFLSKIRGFADAEDLTQKVFLNVFSKGSDCPADLPGFEAYLLKASWHAFLDVVRGMKRKGEGLSLEDNPALAEELLTAPPSQEEEAIGQERARKVQIALDQLSPGQRFCVVLYSEGWKPKETAALRGCTEGAVKALIHQGITRLRLLLKGDFDDFDTREDD